MPLMPATHVIRAMFRPALIVIAAWGVAGAVIAVRYFSWEPRQ